MVEMYTFDIGLPSSVSEVGISDCHGGKYEENSFDFQVEEDILSRMEDPDFSEVTTDMSLQIQKG